METLEFPSVALRAVDVSQTVLGDFKVEGRVDKLLMLQGLVLLCWHFLVVPE
jgi:hypothetical protein